ncbi:hypothetical protein D3C79_775350 [compost metagenome]
MLFNDRCRRASWRRGGRLDGGRRRRRLCCRHALDLALDDGRYRYFSADRITGELAFAVQLIEQCFELVFADLVAGRRRRRAARRSWRSGRQCVGLEGAFAMQLVEQRLELFVSDLVADRCADTGHRFGDAFGAELAFAMQLIEQ